MAKDRLITPSYCFILAANFLLYFGFWLLIPVLPFYLSEFFQAGNSTIGIVLSCYTVAALCIRPFSGYLLDTFARKPLYLFAYFIFMMMFGGYLIAGSLTLFIIFRIIHGVSFGMVTVGGNTVVIDIMPSSRRGEGLGYYGLTNNTAMSIGPMFGLFLHDAGVSFATIFCYAFGSCILGFLCASLVKTPYKPPVKREPISLDRFILMKGLPAGLSLLLLSIPYGMTTNYVAMYARQIGLNTQTGFFFTFMAVGMAISRIFSGKLVDRGKITQVIAAGLYLVVFSFFLLSTCVYLIQWNDTACTLLFFGIALLMGVGFGIMFPAFNTLFVNLAPNSQRGTATSTYLTSWDVGIGIGMLTGGYIAEISTFDKAYLFGACLTVVSALYFRLKVTPHYHKQATMRKKERYEKVIAWFQDNIPVAETELHYNNPYELLIAVILSAQCTDKRVNIITPPLYKDFPTPEALAATTPEVIFEYIRSVSYPNNKAKHLVGMAKMLVNDFNSEVPDNLEDLIKLPGVGRKTANVIQSVVFKKAAMAVDTHVFRVSHRIGLVPDSCTTPFSVEKELVKNIPEKLIPIAHHWLILHGRYVCQARTPKCDTCGLQMMCKYFCNTYKVTKEEPKAKNK